MSHSKRSAAIARLILPCILFSASPAIAQTSLNLGSKTANIPASSLNLTHPVTIVVGGHARSVTPAMMLTPAELTAVYQVMDTGHQALNIGAGGNAISGSVLLGNAQANLYSNLSVPQKVQVIDTASSLNLAGALTNAGKFFFSSNTPANLLATAVYNSGALSAQAGLTISADSIRNSGTIAAMTGNLNFQTLTPKDLFVDNRGGSLQALNGDINIRDASYTGSNNASILGGNIASQNLNIYSGSGAVNVNVGQLTSTVNVCAAETHITAATSNLRLGNLNISGDPSFYNTAGNVMIDGSLLFSGQALAIVASNNILSSAMASIDTSSASSNGGAVILIAGAKFTVTPTNASSGTTSGQSGGAGDTSNTLKITGGSTNGGFIDLTGGSGTGGGITPVTINTTSTSVTPNSQSGGDVTLVAFGGKGTNAGTINLPTSALNIQTGGAGSGTNGNVTMIAGSTVAGTQAINIGGINTGRTDTGSTTGGGGIVSLSTAQPKITGGTSVSILNGALVNGSGTFTAGKATPGDIVFNADVDANQLVVNSGGNISWFSTAVTQTDVPNLFPPGGYSGPFSIVFNPAGTTAYVTNFGSNNFGGSNFNPATDAGKVVSVINVGLNQAVFNINVGVQASGIAIDPTGKFAYVTNFNDPVTNSTSPPGQGSVSVIDLSSNFAFGQPIPVGAGAERVAFNPTGKFAYVTNYLSNTVSVINTSTRKVVQTINVGLNPGAIVVNHAGTFAYVANSNSNTISVINLKTNTVTATIGGLNAPYTMDLNPSGTQIYVSNSSESGPAANSVAIIDTKTNKIVSTITDFKVANFNPAGVSFNPSGTMAYITSYVDSTTVDGGSHQVAVVNTATHTVVQNLSLTSSYINAVAFNPSGNLAYTANYNQISDQVTTYDPTKGTVTALALTPPQLQANSIKFVAGTAGGGSISAYTQTLNLTANAVGNVAVYNFGSVALKPDGSVHNGATGTYTVNTTPDLSGNGQISIGDVVTVKNGTISLQSSEGPGSGQGGMTMLGSGGLLSARSLNLSDLGITRNSIGDAVNNIATAVTNLNVSSAGSVFVTDSLAMVVNVPVPVGTLSLTDTAKSGGITVTNVILATTEVDLATNAKSGTAMSGVAASLQTPVLQVSLAGTSVANFATSTNNITKLTSIGTDKSSILIKNGIKPIEIDAMGANQSLTVATAGAITQGAQTVTAGSLSLTGASVVLNDINVPQLSLNANSAGATVVDSAQTVQLNTSNNSGGTLSLVAAHSIVTTGTVAAPNISLTANGGGITVQGTLGTTLTLTNTLNAAGQITTSSKGQIGGVNVALTTTGQSGAINARTAAGNSLSAITDVGPGNSANNVTLNNIGSVTLGQLNKAGGNFTVTSSGGISMYGQILADGGISMQGTEIQLQGSPANPTLGASNGNILLYATNKTAGSINIAFGSVLSATSTNSKLGNVIISVGSANPAKTNTTPPIGGNVVPTGQIFYGKNNITALNGDTPPDAAGVNTLTAGAGKSITFSTGSLPADAIVLGGKVSITASGRTETLEDPADEAVVDTEDDI